MAHATEVEHGIDAQLQAGDRDRAIARLASRQHGVVSRAQLFALGLARGGIAWRLKHERLHVLYRGAYAVGHTAVSREGRWMAAVLAAGPGAVLSHRSAGACLDLLGSERAWIDVSVSRQRSSRPGVRVHHTKLKSDEVTSVNGIPVTTVARTLLDLAAVVSRPRLERALERAEALRLADRTPLTALLERYPRRQGTRALREILDRGVSPTLTRSELEDRFLALVEGRRLPRPRVNVRIGTFEVDFLWRAQRLVVELDGRETHISAAAFERDRARDRALQAAGWRVVRVTWRQLHDDANAVADDLARLLGTAGWTDRRA
jgi:very-short-patch-repair endonuclease/predicted transcriptional regulator of viral defense system